MPQGNQVTTIQYKNFGVSVDFTPTVLDGNRMSIKVRPEVSELTTVGAITINGTQVPALNVRRAETTVELGSGESFAIAGLFQNNGTNDITGLPLLGNLPILGALFRSTTFQRNESELVIIVTPYVVKPADQATALRLPTEGLQLSSDIERILLGRLTAMPADGTTPPNNPATDAAPARGRRVHIGVITMSGPRSRLRRTATTLCIGIVLAGSGCTGAPYRRCRSRPRRSRVRSGCCSRPITTATPVLRILAAPSPSICARTPPTPPIWNAAGRLDRRTVNAKRWRWRPTS